MVLVHNADIPLSLAQDQRLFLKHSAVGVASQSAGAAQAVCLPDAAPREWHGWTQGWKREKGLDKCITVGLGSASEQNTTFYLVQPNSISGQLCGTALLLIPSIEISKPFPT